MCWAYKPIKMTAVWTGSTGFVCSIRPSDFEYPPKKVGSNTWIHQGGSGWFPEEPWIKMASEGNRYGWYTIWYTMIHQAAKHMVFFSRVYQGLSGYSYFFGGNLLDLSSWSRDGMISKRSWYALVPSRKQSRWFSKKQTVDFEISNSFFAVEIDRICFPPTKSIKSIKRGDACQSIRANASFRNAGMWVWVSPLRDHKKNYSSLSSSCSQSQHHV